MRSALWRRRRGRPCGSVELRGRARRALAIAAVELRVRRAVARAVQDARTSVGVAASELACAVGLHVQTIHAYERGAVMPPIARLVQIADALGLPVDHLTGGL